MSLPTEPARPPEVSIHLGGESLGYDDLVSEEWMRGVDQLRERFVAAQPYPHIVLEKLFSPKLLEAVLTEFEFTRAEHWKSFESKGESTLRSDPNAQLGPATRLYFDTLSSGRFLRFLSALTDIPSLLSDPMLRGGGLHESREGGRFDVHLDFAKHSVTELDNRLVLITYLNKDWLPSYGGLLELWSAAENRCVETVVPEFGRTLIFQASSISLHGHPQPIATPDGRKRRSLGAYFYTNGVDDAAAAERYTTYFAKPADPGTRKLKKKLQYFLPPVAWDALRFAKRHLKPGGTATAKENGSADRKG